MIPNAVKQGIDVPEAVSWRDAMRRVAIEVASPNAALADLTATFPAQTFEALRRNKMLGLMVPTKPWWPGIGIAQDCQSFARFSQARAAPAA